MNLFTKKYRKIIYNGIAMGIFWRNIGIRTELITEDRLEISFIYECVIDEIMEDREN